MTTPARSAGIYVRISSDPKGERLGVARQRKECKAKAASLGWVTVEIYEDNDISAFSGKHRPDFERLLSDADAGRIDAIVVWSLDRLTRRPIEIERVIDLADKRGIALATVGGDFDLASSQGRTMARVVGAFANQEQEIKRDRMRAANDQRAESGKPHAGRRSFGYSPDGLEVVDAEAAEIRKACEALLSGISLRSIVAGLSERGVVTTAGNPWKPTELRRLLANPRLAGLRVHRGVVVGQGGWAAVIDAETHSAVNVLLSDPARRRPGRPRRYLLSGIGRCGVCGARVYGRSEKRGPLYICESRAHIGRRAEKVEEMVVDHVVGRLSLPDAATFFARHDATDEADALRTEGRGLRIRLDALAEAFAIGDVDGQQLSAGSKRLRDRLQYVTEALAATARTPVLASLVAAANVRQAWNDLDIDIQREIISTIVTVTLDPVGRGARRFDPATVRIEAVDVQSL